MFFNFDPNNTEIYDTFLYIGKQLSQHQQIRTIPEFTPQQFLQMAMQIAQANQPMKLVWVKWMQIWDQFEQKQKQLQNKLEYMNNLYVKMEKEENAGI